MTSVFADFAHFCSQHSWYKHLSLEGEWYQISLEKGLHHKGGGRLVDTDNFHWHFYEWDEATDKETPFKVKLNYSMVAFWDRHGSCACDYFLHRDLNKINNLIATKYPHLSPVDPELCKMETEFRNGGLYEFLQAECNELLKQVLIVCEAYYDKMGPEGSVPRNLMRVKDGYFLGYNCKKNPSDDDENL